MKRWYKVIRGCGIVMLGIAMLCSVGCQQANEAGEETGVALEKAGEATMDAVEEIGDEIQDAADEVDDKL